jgi:peptide/nickel transport system ATP-binding protein
MNAPPLLQVRDLHVRHRSRDEDTLRGVSLELAAGEALAIVGESGSGKSTLVRAILRLLPLSAGQVLLNGVDLAILTPAELRARRRDMQLVFQDPVSSLDPAMTVARIVAEPLCVHASQEPPAARRQRVVKQLSAVGLDAGFLSRRPQHLSGGQAQRVAIARALIANPALLICDEPVSALDLALRAQVLALLAAERRRRGLAMLFVTHDLAAARALCERVLVLQSGEVVEQGATASIFAGPAHPHTQALLAATLTVDPRAARAGRSARAGE